MTVYSYNSQQLQKKVAPKKLFWTGNKIAVAVASGSLVLFGSLVANVPNTAKVTSTSVPVPASLAKSPESVPSVIQTEPDWKQKQEEHFRLQNINSQRAAEAQWDRAYVETREAQCAAGNIHRQYC